MKRSVVFGVFAACGAVTIGAGALDSVPHMYGSEGLRDVTQSVLGQCPALGTYPVDNDGSKAGVQPIFFQGQGFWSSTNTGDGEHELADLFPQQLIAPMPRPLGVGSCSSSVGIQKAEGIVFALDSADVVFGPGVLGAAGLDYTTFSGTGTPTPGDPTNNWRTVLREIYTGMGSSGTNIYTRDCNSAARRALVSNWDNLFAGTNPHNVCTDSNPDAVTEPGLRHAFRRDEESGATAVFLQLLGLPPIDFMQTIASDPPYPHIPDTNSFLQHSLYRALANSPFCNVHRAEDDYQPVGVGTSQIPPMWQVGVPASAGTGTGWAPLDPELGFSQGLSPYMPEEMDQDPIRRKCIGPTVNVSDAPDAPREEVCSADGQLGLVLPISVPPGLTAAELYPSAPCEDTHDFEFGPAPTRLTGDALRCPNGDAPQDGKCFLPVRTDTSRTSGFAFDCLNWGLNVPGALFDTDGNGQVFTDAPNTDGKLNADGRAYNLILRRPDGTIRTMARPNTNQVGSMAMPIVGAFYRLHSSRSGLAVPNDKRRCASATNSDDQIGCLAQLNPCSMGYARNGAVFNNPGNVAGLVNGVAPTQGTVQALVSGGTTYPLAAKLYLNTVRGFETLLTSSDPAAPTGKDAELDLAKCFATGAGVLGFMGIPGLTSVPGGAVCEDFPNNACSGVTTNTDACQGNPPGIPSSACNNGVKDGDETAVDVCPAVRPSCVSGVCQ